MLVLGKVYSLVIFGFLSDMKKTCILKGLGNIYIYIHIYIYVYTVCPFFWWLNPPKHGTFLEKQNKGSICVPGNTGMSMVLSNWVITPI